MSVERESNAEKVEFCESTVCKVRPRYVAREAANETVIVKWGGPFYAPKHKHEQVIWRADLAPFHEAVRERLQ